MNAPLTGIVPPMITPLSGRDALDVAGLERLIEHVLAGGVSGLFILGTTGEGPSLGYRLRKEFIERTCSLARGRVPVLVGITDTAFVESVNAARWAADAGADIILLDNMNPVQLRLAVQKIKGRAKTEASGGINLANVRIVAETGVDFISVGALTHAARAVDIGLDFES